MRPSAESVARAHDTLAGVSRGSSSRGNRLAWISFALSLPTPLSPAYDHRPMKTRRVSQSGIAAMSPLVQISGLIVLIRSEVTSVLRWLLLSDEVIDECLRRQGVRG